MSSPFEQFYKTLLADSNALVEPVHADNGAMVGPNECSTIVQILVDSDWRAPAGQLVQLRHERSWWHGELWWRCMLTN
eukprot:CAMPEP_0179139490 /NCGR_PEP_ID=MMETSP0796-20121207/66722_1 /TAXON_ID=73915 /ORGANISM="Pyrodinium bahamense, Strain pbaha01" /LENGTH=77 /DNA_ID=CAMNT_0020838933 /DNA_START=31 /DNA_END=261 /DNA_ORIENTATION=+